MEQIVLNKNYILLSGVLLGSFGLYSYISHQNEQKTFEEIHNKEMLIKYIDTMSVNDMRNKLKLCAVDSKSCTIVFEEK